MKAFVAGSSGSQESVLKVAQTVLEILKPLRIDFLHARSVSIGNQRGKYEQVVKRLAPRSPIDPGKALKDWQLIVNRDSETAQYDFAQVTVGVVSQHEARRTLSGAIDWHLWGNETLPKVAVLLDVHHHAHTSAKLSPDSVVPTWTGALNEAQLWRAEMLEQITATSKGSK